MSTTLSHIAKQSSLDGPYTGVPLGDGSYVRFTVERAAIIDWRWHMELVLPREGGSSIMNTVVADQERTFIISGRAMTQNGALRSIANAIFVRTGVEVTL
jgi:hypothetical protein